MSGGTPYKNQLQEVSMVATCLATQDVRRCRAMKAVHHHSCRAATSRRHRSSLCLLHAIAAATVGCCAALVFAHVDVRVQRCLPCLIPGGHVARTASSNDTNSLLQNQAKRATNNAKASEGGGYVQHPGVLTRYPRRSWCSTPWAASRSDFCWPPICRCIGHCHQNMQATPHITT
jgi:hypothetical protein